MLGICRMIANDKLLSAFVHGTAKLIAGQSGEFLHATANSSQAAGPSLPAGRRRASFEPPELVAAPQSGSPDGVLRSG
jgi:hypothetical protein